MKKLCKTFIQAITIVIAFLLQKFFVAFFQKSAHLLQQIAKFKRLMYREVKNMTETDILYALRNGDVTALEFVYKDYADRLYSFALSVSKNKEIAEDVTADVFIKLYTFLSKGNDVINLKAFLYTAVRNAVYDNFKSASRNTPLPDEDIFIDDSYAMDEKLAINDALGQLPQDEREIVLLYCYEGFLHKEIAEILDVPEGTVRWKYRKALSALKSILGGN